MNVQKFAPVYRNTVGLIMGETVHSLFGINPKSKQLLPLKNLADRQKMFGEVKIIAIDESSMLGRATFGQIVHRCTEIFGPGGVSFLLAGDALQLPPVLQFPIWSTKAANECEEAPESEEDDTSTDRKSVV